MPSKLPRLRGVRKPKGMKKINPPHVLKPQKPPKQVSYTEDMPPDLVRRFYSLCGDREERKEIVWRYDRLREDNPRMTFPEGILYIMLEDRNRTFSYQSPLDGGRTSLGGYVVDFIIDMGGYAFAVLVNGDYWHSLRFQEERDLETKLNVVGQEYEGLTIEAVLEIWESTLLSCSRDDAVDQLLIGLEVGKQA